MTFSLGLGRPFLSAGMDYACLICLRASKGRGRAITKGCSCLFVCTATKAVHLEAVSDLTTDDFLADFRRFVSRKERCIILLSDNATNFRGADRELREMFRAASEFYRHGRAQLAREETDWRFIPPSARHFGGLWKDGVRSTKHHLRRVVGEQLLTYEELATLLAQMEACLEAPVSPQRRSNRLLCAYAQRPFSHRRGPGQHTRAVTTFRSCMFGGG